MHLIIVGLYQGRSGIMFSFFAELRVLFGCQYFLLVASRLLKFY